MPQLLQVVFYIPQRGEQRPWQGFAGEQIILDLLLLSLDPRQRVEGFFENDAFVEHKDMDGNRPHHCGGFRQVKPKPAKDLSARGRAPQTNPRAVAVLPSG